MLGEYDELTCDNGYIMPDCPDERYPDCIGVLKSLFGNGICHMGTPYNTPECGYDDGDCQQESQNKFYTWVVAIAIALGFNLLICCCLSWKYSCCREPDDPQNPEETRRNREAFILSHIIRKSVKTVKDHQSQKEICVLPHEEELSRRSTHLSKLLSSSLRENSFIVRRDGTQDNQNLETNNDEEDQLNEISHLNKDDIYIESLHSIRSAMEVNVYPNKDENGTYSPQSCPICFEPYKKGDEVAWSRNIRCYHAYHLNCILYWLMNHDTCPMCRADYIFERGPISEHHDDDSISRDA